MPLLFVGAFIIGLVAWATLVIYSFKIRGQVKPGASRVAHALRYNRFNVIFRPELLTDEGLRYRRILGRAPVALVTAVSVGLLVGLVMRQLG